MSRFFNESRKAMRHQDSEDAIANVEDRVTRLRNSLETQDPPPVNAEVSMNAEVSTEKQTFEPLEKLVKVAPAVLNGNLESCRRIRLPRNHHKSLLMPQYNLSLQQSVEAYRTLRTRVVKHQEQTGMHSLLISSAGPSEGKTLTAFNLAVCFANIQNWPVLLVDADLRTCGMSRLVGDVRSPGLAEVLEGSCAYESAILQTDVSQLYILPAGQSALPAPELFSRKAFKEFIEWSSKIFKLILLDVPPIPHLADFELIEEACDGVLLVVRLGQTNQDLLAKSCACVDSGKLVGVVVNDSPEEAGSSYYRYLEPGERRAGSRAASTSG